MNMMPAAHWKDKKNSFKKHIGSMDEKQIDDAKEEHDVTKMSENRHKR